MVQALEWPVRVKFYLGMCEWTLGYGNHARSSSLWQYANQMELWEALVLKPDPSLGGRRRVWFWELEILIYRIFICYVPGQNYYTYSTGLLLQGLSTCPCRVPPHRDTNQMPMEQNSSSAPTQCLMNENSVASQKSWRIKVRTLKITKICHLT